MQYGSRSNTRIYFTSADVAGDLGIPIHQVGRLEKRFGIPQRKNRAGNRVFRERELQQFRAIKTWMDQGYETQEIRKLLADWLLENKETPEQFPTSPKKPLKKSKSELLKKSAGLNLASLEAELQSILQLLKSAN